MSFGNFLIKQVVEEISRELPKLATFVTLSPVTNFAAWLKRERAQENSAALNESDKTLFAALDRGRLVARRRGGGTTTGAAAARGGLVLPARAHVARPAGRRGGALPSRQRRAAERINWLADTSDKAMAQGHGLMVNYLYELDDIEEKP